MKENQKRRRYSEVQVRERCTQYLMQVNSYHDLTLKRLAAWACTSTDYLLTYIFPSPAWPNLRDEWAVQRLRSAMDELYQQAKTREDFAAERIARHAGIPVVTFVRLLKQDWSNLFVSLPTPREYMTTVVWELVEAHTPLHLFTRERIAKLSGVKSCPTDGWFYELYGDAYLALRQDLEKQTNPPPPGMSNGRLMNGAWIDLESDVWDLRSVGMRVLHKDQLRPDIAAVAWPFLREELRTGERAPSTIAAFHRAFLVAERVLAETHPDIRFVSLEALQYAWHADTRSLSQRRLTRLGLLRLYELLLVNAGSDHIEQQQEWLRITRWLRDLVSVPHNEPAATFLSEEELNIILTCCFADIQTGVVFMGTAPDLSRLSSRVQTQESTMNPRVVIYWAVALTILVMICTGLRRQSVLALETHDWVELHPGLFGIVWHHWKKGEEHLATLSPTVAHHLQRYVDATAALRTAIQTQKVFLNGNLLGMWEQMRPNAWEKRMDEFVVRHRLERNGKPLLLGSTIFRRTFTTRSLYEGQSLKVIGAQLGHTTIMSTLFYSKLDLYEHPAQVRASLDLYGRHALSFWKTPLLLEEVGSEERLSLLQSGRTRDQEVGLCRHEQCVHITSGGPPPCSLCEHLVTGKAFLPAWKAEEEAREETLRQLASIPGSEVVFVQMKGQFAQFKRNREWVQAHCGEE